MLQETEQSPAVVAKLLAAEVGTFAEIGRLFEKSPTMITTAARGSSDHAATFFKYLMEIATGIPVASIGPSVASVYGAKLKLEGGLHFTVSQSGASPDIIAVQDAAKRGGATTVAVVNVTDSPLAKGADIVLSLHAGEEKSVAATKSFIASVAALSGVVAAG
jgi:glucosamine--fructose-6-phosphate aminotransferase (isomerizing)